MVVGERATRKTRETCTAQVERWAALKGFLMWDGVFGVVQSKIQLPSTDRKGIVLIEYGNVIGSRVAKRVNVIRMANGHIVHDIQTVQNLTVSG